MCGIAGELRRDDDRPDLSAIGDMVAAMVPRGPDGGGVWSEGGFQMSPTFPRTAWLPRLTDFARQVPAFSGLTTHLGLAFALVAAVVVWWILRHSRWGYEIRLVGDNPRAAEYAGVRIGRQVVLVLMASGALAGLAGMSEISGVVHRLQGSVYAIIQHAEGDVTFASKSFEGLTISLTKLWANLPR